MRHHHHQLQRQSVEDLMHLKFHTKTDSYLAKQYKKFYHQFSFKIIKSQTNK